MCSPAKAAAERVQADLVLAGRVARSRHSGGAPDGGGHRRVFEATHEPVASGQTCTRALGIRARSRTCSRIQDAVQERGCELQR